MGLGEGASKGEEEEGATGRDWEGWGRRVADSGSPAVGMEQGPRV